MTAEVARAIAMASHAGQRTRSGEPVLAHVARVVLAAPPEVRATAWLHDLAERCEPRAEELRARGMTPVELDALELLTRLPSESYELYTLRIAHATGDAGRIARRVKLADLDDHLRCRPLPGDPPYAWARRRIARAVLTELRAAS